MRINPPVFNIVRALTEDTVIGGYYIPKGAKINDFIIIIIIFACDRDFSYCRYWRNTQKSKVVGESIGNCIKSDKMCTDSLGI